MMSNGLLSAEMDVSEEDKLLLTEAVDIFHVSIAYIQCYGTM